jgi:hypothetical protein
MIKLITLDLLHPTVCEGYHIKPTSQHAFWSLAYNYTLKWAFD